MAGMSGAWRGHSKKGHIQKNHQNGLVNGGQLFENRKRRALKPASDIIWISVPGSCGEPDSEFCLSRFRPASGPRKFQQE